MSANSSQSFYDFLDFIDFEVGDVAGRADADMKPVIHVSDLIGPLLVAVNVDPTSGASLVVSFEESLDNGVVDSYAAQTLRYNGANVSSVTVVRGGTAMFFIEPAAANLAADDWYLRLTFTRAARGRVTIVAAAAFDALNR